MNLHPVAAGLVLFGCRHYRYARFPSYRVIVGEGYREYHENAVLRWTGYGWLLSHQSFSVQQQLTELDWSLTGDEAWDRLNLQSAITWLREPYEKI